MNIHKKVLFLTILFSFLVGAFFLTAQNSLPDPVDYSQNYSIENVNSFKAQNIDVQEDSESGLLTIKGTNEDYSVVQLQSSGGFTKSYDLSKEGSFLKIDPSSGDVIEGKYTISKKNIYGEDLAFSQEAKFGDGKVLRNLPAGTELSYKEGELSFKLPDDSSKYSGEIFSAKGITNFDFDLFNSGGSSKQKLEFGADDGASMNFLGRDISLTKGSVSMQEDYWNVPEASRINDLGNSDERMLIGGENLYVSKDLVPGLSNDLNYDGYLGSEKGRVYVPYQKSATPFKLHNKGVSFQASKEYPDTFLDFAGGTFDNSDKKFYVSMYKDSGVPVIKYNHGVSDGDLVLNFEDSNPYYNPIENGHLSINSGTLPGEGSAILVGQRKDYLPVLKTEGTVQVESDGKIINILSDKIQIDNNVDYGVTESIPMMVATPLENGEKVRIAVADRDTFYFKTSSETPQDVVAVDKRIKGFNTKYKRVLPSKLEPDWFGDGLMRYSLADLKKLNNPEYLGEYDRLNKLNERIEKFRKDNYAHYQAEYVDKFGSQAFPIMKRIDDIYRDSPSSEIAQSRVEAYEHQLQDNGLLNLGDSLPAFDLRDSKDYDHFQEWLDGRKNILDNWVKKEYVSPEEAYNFQGQVEKGLQYYGHRFAHYKPKKYSTTDVYLINY